MSTRYYPEKKERLQKKPRERYQNFSEEKKNKKQKCGPKRHKNLPQDEKQRQFQYRKHYCKGWKK